MNIYPSIDDFYNNLSFDYGCLYFPYLVLYVSNLHEDIHLTSIVEKDFSKFNSDYDVSIANIKSKELDDVPENIYTRDLMKRN